MKTLIIRVRDDPAGTGWPVELRVDTDGRWEVAATGTIPATLPALALPGHEAGGDIVAYLLRWPSPEGEGYREIGRYLYALLHDSGIGAAWDTVRKEHESPAGPGIRTILDVAPQALRRLPWEATIDRRRRPCFSDPANPWVRGAVDFDARLDPYLIPLRILVVVGSPSDNALRWEAETEAIRLGVQAFRGKAEVKYLCGPLDADLFDLHDRFQPNIFHFIGHGDEAVSGSEPALMFERQHNGAPANWELTAERIVDRLGTQAGRLAILNACRSNSAATPQAKATLHAQTWSLAEAFRDAGYGSVVGMQGDIPSTAAVAFTTTLYRSIGEGKPVDVAVADARRRIGDRRSDVLGDPLRLRDWVLPSLLVSHVPEQVLSPRYGVLADDVTRIDLADEFQAIAPFVDRTDPRDQMCELIEGTGQHGCPKLMVVHGADDVGKTWLVWHVLRTYAWQGLRVRYVDLAIPGKDGMPNALAVLRAIRDGAGSDGVPPSFIAEGLPAAARDRLNHALHYLRRGELPPQFDPAQPVPQDDNDDWAPGEQVGDIFQPLLDALDIAANGQPLILALDHLDQVEPSAHQQLANSFLRSVARGNSKHVRVVVALQTAGYQEPRWPSNLKSMAKEVELKGIGEALEPLAREFVHHHGYDPNHLPTRRLIDWYNENLADPRNWNPNVLNEIRNGLRSAGIPRNV